MEARRGVGGVVLRFILGGEVEGDGFLEVPVGGVERGLCLFGVLVAELGMKDDTEVMHVLCLGWRPSPH